MIESDLEKTDYDLEITPDDLLSDIDNLLFTIEKFQRYTYWIMKDGKRIAILSGLEGSNLIPEEIRKSRQLITVDEFKTRFKTILEALETKSAQYVITVDGKEIGGLVSEMGRLDIIKALRELISKISIAVNGNLEIH